MRKVLVVVDYQNDFVDGALGFEGAADIEDKIVELIQEFKANGDLVAFTKDTHDASYMNTVEGKNLPIPHCIKGTHGHELREAVDDEKEYLPVFEKATFPSLDLANFLRGTGADEVYLCGLVSDICVFRNAIMAKAALPNSEIYVIRDATDSNDRQMQEKSFEMLKHLHIKVI